MVLPKVTTLAEAQSVIWEQAEEIEKLSNELAWFKRQMFGSQTEHYIPEDDTPSLFPEDEEKTPVEKAPQKVSEHERTARQPNALSEIPADLPREERVIDVPEEKRQGMILIGYEESERIAYQTGLYVIHFKRAKYADPSDALRGVVTAPAPGDVFDSVSGRTRYDVSFIAKVVADKVENAIPLERQARMFSNDGLPVAPSTLEDLYKRTADALRPLYERMVDRIMQCDVLHADETFIKLMVKGAKKCKQAYLWCRLTGVGPPMIAFHFSPSRSREVAESLLGDYSGTIIRDSYAAYEKLDCEVACCWAHVRRRFLQAVENGYGKAEPLLKMIQTLYQIERAAKERAEKKGTETALFQERKNVRRQSQKLVREFFEQCRGLKESERPSSLVAQAASYALNIEEELKNS
jgi:transposase IS66